MSTNLQQIGTPLLDMDNIATHLHIKGVLSEIDSSTGEEKYSPFVTLDDLAQAGSDNALIQYLSVDENNRPIPMSRIALAYLPDDATVDTVIDRNTVRNAKYLDGKSSDFFTKQELTDKINNSTAMLAEAFNKEIADIRSEHIQLLSYVAKHGLIDSYKPYAGFYDPFRENYPVHQNTYLATAFIDSQSQNMVRIKEEEMQYFAEGDYVILVNGDNLYDNLNRAVLKIDKIQGNTLIFSGYTGFPIKASSTKIYRSLGSIHKGSFSFGYFEERYASDSKIYTGVDDDNYRTRRRINKSHTGYATTFRINPNRASGIDSYYLSSVEICARKVGSPGALKCYIINAVHISDFEDPTQARDEGYIIAESQPLVLDSKAGEAIVEFDFSQDGKYPLLENIDQGIDGDTGRTRFCMIIEALTADSTNYYELLFLQHYDAASNTLSDLQLNNIVYEYAEQPSTELMSTDNFQVLTTNSDINNSDLFYGVVLRSVNEGYFVPSDIGVYSAEFKTYEPIRVNNARLTMRVAREGYFTVSNTSGNTNNDVIDGGTIRYIENRSFRIPSEQSSYFDGFAVLSDQGDSGNRKIVVGTHITELERVDGDKLIIKKGANIKVGDPVYPMGYTASLLCSNKVWDNERQSYVIQGETIRIPLVISYVQPAYFEKEKEKMIINAGDSNLEAAYRSRLADRLLISDNLIFEADLNSEKEFNHFQLQVFWRSMAGKPCQSFAGRIYDLSVSLNRKVFW